MFWNTRIHAVHAEIYNELDNRTIDDLNEFGLNPDIHSSIGNILHIRFGLPSLRISFHQNKQLSTSPFFRDQKGRKNQFIIDQEQCFRHNYNFARCITEQIREKYELNTKCDGVHWTLYFMRDGTNFTQIYNKERAMFRVIDGLMKAHKYREKFKITQMDELAIISNYVALKEFEQEHPYFSEHEVLYLQDEESNPQYFFMETRTFKPALTHRPVTEWDRIEIIIPREFTFRKIKPKRKKSMT